MVDYEKLYHVMVDASEKAIEQIELHNYGTALDTLKRGEQNAEKLYIEQSETESEAHGLAGPGFPSEGMAKERATGKRTAAKKTHTSGAER